MVFHDSWFPFCQTSIPAIIRHLRTIAPPPISPNKGECTYPHSLTCPLCLELLHQPIELSCGSLVCLSCCCKWLQVSGKIDCPCCRKTTDLMLLIAHVHQTDYQFLCNISKIRFLNNTSAQHDLPLLIFDFKGHQDSNERDIRQPASVDCEREANGLSSY